jgi:hypothetical protein
MAHDDGQYDDWYNCHGETNQPLRCGTRLRVARFYWLQAAAHNELRREMMDDLGRMVTRTMVRDELMGAVEQMDPDVAITPRALTEELARQTVDAMSTLGYPVHGKVNDTMLYRRPAPDAADRTISEGVTRQVPGTPRDPRDWRYDEAWLLRLVDEQQSFFREHAATVAYPTNLAVSALRYALDKAGLTLVER